MGDVDDLERSHELLQDLVAFSESRPVNLDRLFAHLDSLVDDFRSVFDKSGKSDGSRQKIASGKVEIDGETFSFNDEFQQSVYQLADALELDELKAAKLLLESQGEAERRDISLIFTAITRYHERLETLLEAVGLILRLSLEVSIPEEPKAVFKQAVDLIVQPQNVVSSRKNEYLPKSLRFMTQVKGYLQNLTQRLQNLSVLGQRESSDIARIFELQRLSLHRQHEYAGLVVFFLIKSDYASVDDFYTILTTVKAFDKYDNLLVHFIPSILASITEFGSPEGSASLDDAKQVNAKIVSGRENDPWVLQYFQASITACWLSEFGGWFGENHAEQGSEEDSEKRSQQFMNCLKEGAFDFILSVAADVKDSDWVDPAREGLREWLQRKSPVILSDAVSFSTQFRNIILEQFETFVDAFISNMPDTLRRLKIDEEEQILLNPAEEHALDLEKFLLIIAYVFDRPDSAMSFWEDAESNLFGFLQWASRRQTTPLASAFCEMLSSLSKGPDCASAAHRFLLEDGAPASGKFQKIRYLCWDQILNSLNYYASKIRDKPAIHSSSFMRSGRPSVEEAELEPDVSFMLESSLRLVTVLARESHAARSWLWTQTKVPLLELLVQFCSSAIPSRLRACTLNTMDALLTEKSREQGEMLWQTIDQWISGTASTSSMSTTSTPRNLAYEILRQINSGFEEPDAFVRLMKTLVQPYEADGGLNDGLPFPEYLGSASRMPGIEPYTDFVLGEIFGSRIKELSDAMQRRMLRLSCLDFMGVCLTTFNENLLSLAQNASFSVDSAVNTSSLAAYVQLHPFARVMDWIFSKDVMDELLRTIHEDLDILSSASPDSSLVMSLIRGIEVMTLAIKLQITYLDVVKPLVRKSPPKGSKAPASAFGRIEDAVLGNLQLCVDLSLYSSLPHYDLVLASVRLLELLTSSSHLNEASSLGPRKSTANLLVEAVDMAGETNRVSRALLPHMSFSEPELELGSQSLPFLTKTGIFDLLLQGLAACNDRPNLVHIFLGFSVNGNRLEIEEGGAFANGSSLFHSLISVILDYPDRVEESDLLSAWLIRFKASAMEILYRLWTSPLTAVYALTELRSHDFIFALYLHQIALPSQIVIDGLPTTDPAFLVSDSASGACDLFNLRTHLYNYLAIELRFALQQRAPSLKSRLVSTLLGSTNLPSGEVVSNPTVFDLFDFIDLAFADEIPQPPLNAFADINFDLIRHSGPQKKLYDLLAVEETLLLKQNELAKAGLITDANTEALVIGEAQAVLMYLSARNHAETIFDTRFKTLKAWTELVMVILQTAEFESKAKTSFILQVLEIVLPKLEQFSLSNVQDAGELAKLTKVLILEMDFKSPLYEKGRASDIVNERLFSLFRISLRGVHTTIATPELRENLYGVCYRYLTQISDVLGDGKTLQRHSTQTISSAGERLIDVICDDALGGGDSCRISAFLLLDALVDLSNQEASPFMIKALNRVNFTQLLVSGIRDMPEDLENADSQDVDSLISFFHAKLSLLLRLCQSRSGASVVLGAGLFQAVHDSRLFSIDPDLGIAMDNPEALKRFYELLLAVVQIINAAVISRGEQNEQTLEAARQFLASNRQTLVSVLKRNAKIGGYQNSSNADLEELVEALVLLMSLSDFLDFENQPATSAPSQRTFT